ncbi:MAG: hypothetical protein ACODAQ_11600 [Phycisphaeraceae bacterium]
MSDVRDTRLSPQRCAVFSLVGCVLVVGVVTFGAPAVLAEDNSFSEDFESAAAGDVPTSGAVTSASADARVDVVGEGTTPADPFGSADDAGNQSLRLEDGSTTQDARVKFPAAGLDEPMVAGTLRFRVYVEQSEATGFDRPLVNVKLGHDGAAGGSFKSEQIGPWLRLGSPDADGLTVVGGPDMDNTAALNEPHTVTIAFDAGAGTWTGTVDGEPMTADDGETITFPFRSNVAAISQVELQSGFGSADKSRAYIDDITLTSSDASSEADE